MEINGNDLGAKRGNLNIIVKNVIINALKNIVGKDI
jgi:hypothetical protein